MSKLKIGINVNSFSDSEKLKHIQELTGLEIVNDISNLDFCLQMLNGKLQLQRLRAEKIGPLEVDFVSGSLNYRIRKGGAGQELVVKAIGPKDKYPKVLDGTAGLGRESFILASQGFQVTACEQSSLLYSLVEDAFLRWKAESQIADEKLRLEFINQKFENYLKSLIDYPDVIYIDPMFPERKKKASVKKEMKYFQEILQHDDHAEEMLHIARSYPVQKIVVKRPAFAPIVAKDIWRKVESKSLRFEIYKPI